MGVEVVRLGTPAAVGGGGAPVDASYVVGAADATLTAELVLGTAVIMAGTEAARPAASLAGRLYFATDTLRLFRDTGAAWATVGVQALAELAERLHASLTGVGTDDHHPQVHAIGGADHSGSLAHTALASVTADQHHAQAHVLAGVAGLGPDHSVSGLTAGQVLRASGAAAAAFAQLAHADLGSVTADQHHAQSHTHGSHSGIGADDHHAQAHAIVGADHTLAGSAAGRFLRATSATAFAFEAVPFSVGGVILDPTGARDVMVWRAPFACTVTNVRGHRKGGTGATVNARRNQTSDHLASALSLTTADAWADGGAVQNTAYAAGDDLEIRLASITGAVTEIAIQVDFTRP